MSATTDYMSPFNDGYNIFNQFDRILFVAKHPLLQSELNELQSGQHDQQRWLADWTMNNGTILAGMGLQNRGYSAGKSAPDNTNPNLFSTKNLTSNSKYDDLIITTGDNYTDHGEVDVTSDATDDSQPLDMNISYNIPSGTQYITMSFDICETGSTDDGELENIGIELANGTSITEATIDGRILKNGELEDDAGYNLTDTSNDMINLSDGNYHKVVITMDVSKVGSATNSLDLLLNAGYLSVSEGCNVKFDHFKIEKGTEPTTWELSSDDIPEGSDVRNDTVFISNGFVYLNGYVRRFKAQSINIKGEGFEKIGVHLTHSIVSGATDKEIDDETQGTSTYGQNGADRQKYDLTLSYSNSTTSTPHDVIIYYLYNGKVIGRANWNRSERFENTLAQRTYETNGSFLSKGLRMYAQPNRLDPELINLQFTPGVAYVLGHRIQKDGSDILPIPTERETMRMQEPRILRVDTTSDGLKFHDISFENPYIRPEYEMNPADNNEYTGGVKVTDQTNSPQLFNIDIDFGQPSQPNGIANSSAEFNMDNDQILIDDGAYVIDPQKPNIRYYKNYTENMNTNEITKERNFVTAEDDGYNLTTNEIQWLNENSPFDSGDSAEITGLVQMTYHPYNSAFECQSAMNGEPSGNTQHTESNTTLTPDYYLIKYDNKYYISFNESDKSKDITGAANNPKVHLSGITPDINNSDHPVEVTYYTYLAREDLITIDRNGHYFDVHGDPDLQNRVMPPINKSRGDNLTLDIGYVTVLPNQQIVHTQMATVPKVPFTNINSMRLELAALSYNMSVLSARQSSMSYVDPVTLIDIFSDFFNGTDKADLTDANFHILYNAAPYITPEYEAEGYAPLVSSIPLLKDQNTLTMPLDKNGDNIVENTNYLNQDHQSTASLPLNNFGLRENVGDITCDPEFINDKLTTEQIQEPATVKVMDGENANNYLEDHNDPNNPYNILYADGENGLVDKPISTSDGMIGQLPVGGSELQKKSSTLKMYNRSYIAPQLVHIQGAGFIPNSTGYSVILPNEGNLHLGVIANLSNLNSDVAKLPGYQNTRNYAQNNTSDEPGTVNADGDGNISCWFIIPKGRVHAGIQTVCLQNNGGEYGIDHINANESQPVQYNTTDDVVVDNYDLVTQDHNIDSAAINSLSASASAQASYLGSQVASLSTSTSYDIESLSDVESDDDSTLNSAIGSGNASMDAITSAEQADRYSLDLLTNVVNSFDDYTYSAISTQSTIDNGFQNEANDLYSSANSLYIDHMNTETELGNVRSNVDHIANVQIETVDALNSDVNQINTDFTNVNNWEGNADTQLQNDANSINTNTQQISNNQEQNQDVNTKMWAESSNTFRQLIYRETNPDVMAFGSQGTGFQQWCTKWHMSPGLVNLVNYNLLKAYAPMYKTWRAGNDWNRSQTQGGIWISGVEIISPYEQDTPQSWADASNKLQEAGFRFHHTDLLNNNSPYASVPVTYKSLIPKSEQRTISRIFKKKKHKRNNGRDTLRNRIKRHRR